MFCVTPCACEPLDEMKVRLCPRNRLAIRVGCTEAELADVRLCTGFVVDTSAGAGSMRSAVL
jgi:hypothetical protein